MDDTKFVRGAQKLGQRIATIRANLQIEPIVEEIGALLLKRTLVNFDKEVDPDGVPWKDLNENTVKFKRRKGFTKKLQRTGSLRNAIKLIRGGVGTLATNTGAGVRIGVEDQKIEPYARAQNFGTKTIPARRFLGVGALDIKAVDSLLRRKASLAGL